MTAAAIAAALATCVVSFWGAKRRWDKLERRERATDEVMRERILKEEREARNKRTPHE